jgi:hypothetical protein
MIWNPLLTADTDTAHCGNSVGVLRKVRSSLTVSVKLAHYTDTLERRLVNRQETGSGLRVKEMRPALATEAFLEAAVGMTPGLDQFLSLRCRRRSPPGG